ncbi:MAG: [FeFe] hydrogenase H-cluster radical SAM maturase HydE [Firmicutes bacterium]|nr:[FeFe] hydrogenase H-cluster radical SAM maturase HydE [Dethiobacter sp.]MBS3888110.1 [FeFe] hydrogenase H-cluster radical SAM maturase HydE [Bacillota bacterium]MBS4054554.1 [FeFe] hydrogenase H-cluster radical SAM maturase HydE [Thermaerobacter sp.]
MSKELIARAEREGYLLSQEEIASLLSLTEPADLDELWQAADRVRSQEVGADIWLRGLLEFSNYCSCQCEYCGIRAGNNSIVRYRMTEEEILLAAAELVRAGIGTIVLQSGEDKWWTGERMSSLIASIKQEHDLAITLSLGDRTREELALWRQAGADRYLLRFETSNSALYARFHPDSTLAKRLETLANLKDLGYDVGSGCLVGLPGQTVSDLAGDILLGRDLELDMFGVGPFIPHPATPLGLCPQGSTEMAYKMVALARLVMRKVHIPVTTALATLDEDGREKGWQRGANVVMPNATPAPYRQQYELYQNKRCIDDTLRHCRGCLGGRIARIGRQVGRGHGGSLRQGGSRHE